MRNIISQTVPLQFDTGFSPYHAVAWQAAFSSLCAHGFTGVEIAVAYPQLIDVDALNNCAKENKLKITTISTGQTYGRDGIYLASTNEGIRMRAMDIVRQHIDLSAKIGHPNVTIGLLRGRPETNIDTAEAILSACIAELAEYAAQNNVMLQIEPICAAETNLLNTVADVTRLLDGIGNPSHCGILFDIYHASLMEKDVLDAFQSVASLVTNVHIADSDRGLPSFTKIDFSRILRHMVQLGYQGAFALETLCVPSREYVLENEGRAQQKIRGAIE